MIDYFINFISIVFTILGIFIIISLFFNVYTFGITIDNNINSFMDNNKNKDTNFKNTLQGFFKFTKSITNVLLPTLPKINTNLNLPKNLRNAIPIVPKPNIDTYNINCSLSNISIYYPDPEKIAECVGENVRKAAEAVAKAARLAAEEARKAAEATARAARQAAEEARKAAEATARAARQAAAETARVANEAAQQSFNAVKNQVGPAISSTIAVANNIGDIGNIIGNALGSAFGFGSSEPAMNHAILGLYHRQIMNINNYLRMTDPAVKILFYKDPLTRNVFNKLHIHGQSYASNLDRVYRNDWGKHSQDHEVFSIIWNYMGKIWDPLNNPNTLKLVQNGTLVIANMGGS